MKKADRLKEYRNLVVEIELLEDEKYRLRDGFISARNFDGMPHSKTCSDRVADAAVKLIELQQLIDENLDCLIDSRKEIEGFLEPLSPEERSLLRLRYIDGLNWQEISDKLNYTYQWVHVLHKRVLAELG